MHEHGSRDGDATRTVVIEWAPFRLAPGVSEAELVAASERLQQDFLQHQPGFLGRELLRGPDDQWADLVMWESRAAATAIMPAMGESPACHAYFALMQGADTADPGAGVLHLARVRRWTASHEAAAA